MRLIYVWTSASSNIDQPIIKWDFYSGIELGQWEKARKSPPTEDTSL